MSRLTSPSPKLSGPRSAAGLFGTARYTCRSITSLCPCIRPNALSSPGTRRETEEFRRILAGPAGDTGEFAGGGQEL